MSEGWQRKPQLPRSERVQAAIDAVKAAITGPGKDPDKSVGPFYSNRAMRRGGSGAPRSRIFGETMKIPGRKRR